MELRQIQYFIEVAKLEHVTEASYALHVSQSAVSRQIFKLESELGVDLFIHEGRKVKLTPIGRLFLSHMEHLMKVIDNAQQEISEFLDPERGTVRIGFPSSLAAQMIPTVVSGFREKYPLVHFQLQHGSYKELVEWVVKGDMNLAIMGPVPHEAQIKSEVLFEENFVALLPAGHPLANQTSVKLSDLKDDSFVLFPEGFVLRDMVVKACSNLGFQPKVTFEGDDLDAIKGLVSSGLGLTVLPEIALSEHIASTIVTLPVVEPRVTRDVGVIIPANRELPPTEKLFYDFLKEISPMFGLQKNE
ncbi:LysR family transcriptional regulator, transcription activator of glutamate synthase operon [Fontibacillus panacisegetis]|uniref:LysR family transcriptional regulator, transcription activator of glutamate synthase operon n=1 Tax=Fontibacillus panacisegetis TaxID=670482 RepID=A0A1G7M8D4_9BACL|nr:LysR family transcriptional regulator [Fontibacillus panacisegetis]SDF57965.1 LysR family transcriptional regulator, transcription activator of glutamate synthase operon [Fontibacillus panacisegetis]